MRAEEQFEGAAEEQSSQPPYRAALRKRESRRVHDQLHVDLSQDWEVQLWTRHFQCSEAELRRAVHGACNNEVGEVGAYLRRHRS